MLNYVDGSLYISDWTVLLLSIEVISLFCYSGNLDKD